MMPQYLPLVGLAAIYVLWIFYLAVMNLKRAYDDKTISKVALYLGYPLLLVGYIIDFLVNVVVMTFIMVELPQELLVTSRLSRHIKDGSGWRKSVAIWFCTNLLDKFDPSGCHCK